MNLGLFIFTSILWLGIMYIKTKNYLHILQLEGYSASKFNHWIAENIKKIYKKNDVLFVSFVILLAALHYIFFRLEVVGFFSYILIVLFYLITLINILSKKTVSKKPFVYTKRAKRLVIITLMLVAIDYIVTILVISLITNDLSKYYPVYLAFMSIFSLFSIYYVILANIISVPLENKINKKFYNIASKKIRGLSNLQTVGITGSYGKTSTKFVTATILSEKYKVMNTPESYNTPMGISKVINNDLNDNYEVFIAELGATKTGDINEVANLTNPKIGVLTSIGPCHLQTFGSIQNIMSTKYELIDYLKKDGIAIFNYDNPYVRVLADKTQKKMILYAIDNIDGVDVYATDICVDERGSVFTLRTKEKGCIRCETALLGKHNILNLLAGASVAVALNLSLEEIKRGIAKVTPVKHRLELLDPKTGVLVIDDAFNSNPDGASAALDVLNEFKNRRKIIITPGMIELGDIEKKENEKFGEKISKICDIVILVGKKRTEPIYEGLRKSDFNLENVYVVNSTNESTAIIKTITRHGDIILYENDLPDTYDEN